MTSGCDALRQATRDCRVVLVTATELEAAPLRAALTGAKRLESCGKQVYVGWLSSLEGTQTRVALGVSGCDKVNAAVLVTGLLQAMEPDPELVLQAGIAGAFPAMAGGTAARIGDLVIATREAYSDTGSSSPQGWISAADLDLPIAEVGGVESGGVFLFDSDLVEWAVHTINAADTDESSGEAEILPVVVAGPCVTSSVVTGTDEGARLIGERWGALAESMEGAAAAHVCALCGVPFLEVRGISNIVGDRDRANWQVELAVDVAGRAALALASAFAAKADDRRA